MRSPVAGQLQMERIPLEDHLFAFRCPESGGIFIPAQSYFRWLSKNTERLAKLPACDDQIQENCSDQNEEPKICPESGQLMLRFRVGHGFSFHLDRSPSGSIWLDQGEWEALKKSNFHDELHLIFTAPWQRKIQNEIVHKNRIELLQTKLGPEIFSQLDSLKEALSEHQDKSLALAYLHE